ncbi:MAG: hypothetical protein L6R48_17240, partial [Planctomycetes bacterium]|nr:hypothetical protein [Planctomycetota bacterium]
APPFPPVPPAPPAPPAWRELFPASGLDGWSPVRGRWSRAGALVVGEWGADARGPRLVSAAPLAWDELTCRLRVLDQREMLAEIQLDDYRLFFTVPAEGGRWHDLRLRRRPGAEPVCTCDGRELAPEYEQEVGTPGLLAFYTRGARLEIADARLRLESP